MPGPRKPHRFRWAHRLLRMSPHNANPQKGEDVKQLQLAINKRAHARGLRTIKVDGESGRHTIAAGRRVARSLGIHLRHDGLPVYVQHMIRHPELRTPAQRARGKKWVAHHPPKSQVRIDANTVTGGANVRERIVAAAAHAVYLDEHGAVRFYSQPGAWTVNCGITGEPRGYRSDCSQFDTSMYHSAGAPDPNNTSYTGGFTGTIVAHGTEIRREDLMPGDHIIYGPGNGHHVEVYIGDGEHRWANAPVALRDRTIGHGSPPVDYGDIDMMSGARFFRTL